jgi:hypothetical protein
MDLGISGEDLGQKGYILHTTKPGDGNSFPKAGQTITMSYTGAKDTGFGGFT